MTILKIILEGFGSYANRTVVRLDNPGVTLLSGLNGSGKSTIGRAILWVLTGKTVEGISKADVIHLYSTARVCRVDLFYSFGENSAQVVRLRESGKSGEKLDYYPNGKRFEGATVKDTQERIFSDLGIPENLFSSLFLLSRINAQEFMLSDSNRKKWIEQLFSSDFSDYYLKIGAECNLVAGLLSAKKKNFDTVLWEKSGNEKTIIALEEEKERHILSSQKDTEARIVELKEELRRTQDSTESKQKELLALPEHDFSGATSHGIFALKEELRQAQRKLASVLPVADACLTCAVYQKSSIDQAKIEADILSRTQEIEEKEEASRKFALHQSTVTVIRGDITRLEQQEEMLRMQIFNLQKLRPRDETSGFNEKINNLKEINKLLFQKSLEISLDMLELSERTTILDFWKNAFGNKGIKNFLMDAMRPKLQAFSNAVLQRISPGLAIGFPTSSLLKSGEMKETDFPVLLFLDGQELEYKSLSVGQQGRIDFALLFGRRKLLESWKGVNIELLFLDDFFGSMDIEFISRALDFVKEENIPIFVAHPKTEVGIPDALLEKVNRVIEVELIKHNTILKEEK